MKKSGLVVFLVAIFLSSTACASTIRISSPKIELDLAPGESSSGEIIAENPTEESASVKTYLEDWMYINGSTGEKKFSPGGSMPLSASNWITFSPAKEVIKPFGRMSVRYTIKVPKEAKGGYYSVMFFETILGSAKDEEGVNVLVAGRIGALFFIHVKGTVDKKGLIKSVQIKPPQGNQPMDIVTAFENTGNIDITLSGNFLVMDAAGKVAARGDLGRIYTFPGKTETGKTQWVGRLAKGNYQLLLTYDMGKGQTLVEEKTLVVT